MFTRQTEWTQYPCYYVIAFQGFQRAWLTGPYRTQAEANAVLPHAIFWATSISGDADAANYTYQVAEHYNGGTRSILGELNAQLITREIATNQLQAVAPFMRDTLLYVAQELASFKPDYLRQIGLDVALEQVEKALAIADNTVTEAAAPAAEDDHD